MEESKKKQTKNNRIQIRTTDEQKEALDELCILTGDNITDAIVESVRIRLMLEKSKL